MAAAKKSNGPTATYKVLQPLRHNQKHYAVGSAVELTADEAKTLGALKVVAASEAASE